MFFFVFYSIKRMKRVKGKYINKYFFIALNQLIMSFRKSLKRMLFIHIPHITYLFIVIFEFVVFLHFSF